MILRIVASPLLLATLLFLVHVGSAEVAPDVTVVEEGYNYIAKLPCRGCPFLFQDTSEGLNEPWGERTDDNALVRFHVHRHLRLRVGRRDDDMCV